jgi:ArsR family transcriptional regulator, arsenate/arsenite/antimonite-responsive transcriptional repressor
MDERKAIPAFAALSQETRLRIVRLLVRAGSPGMPAGAIAKAMKASASVVSFHLKELERAGLTTAERKGRTIVHSADYATLTALITFLMRDCCAGHPDICTPAIERMHNVPGHQRRAGVPKQSK